MHQMGHRRGCTYTVVEIERAVMGKPKKKTKAAKRGKTRKDLAADRKTLPERTGVAVPGRNTGKVSKAGKLQNVSQERLKRREQYARQDGLLDLYATGMSLESIALEEALDMRAVVNSISTALDRHVKSYAEPSPQHQFVRYAVFNMGLIRKLDEARRMFLKDPEGKQYAMIVSSIKAQHDIYDKIQTKGTQLGVIQKRKANAQAIAGGKKAVLKELEREATLLLDIVEEFDEHTQFKRRRRIQAQIKSRESETTTTVPAANPTERQPVAYIRRVIREDGLVVRDIPDAFFRTKLYKQTADGSIKDKPKKEWTKEDYERTKFPTPDHLLNEHNTQEEQEELEEQLQQERAQKKTG